MTVPPVASPAAPSAASADRLDSWKQIAAHLGCSQKTAQRWERDAQLPVYRLPHTRRDSVYAFRAELDAWSVRRGSPGPQRDPGLALVGGARSGARARPSPDRPWRLLLPGAALATTVTVALVLLAPNGPSPAPSSWPTTGHPRPLATDAGREFAPSLSPDGRFVAYVWERPSHSGIYIAPTGGGPPRRMALSDGITVDRAIDSHPAWAPDGKTIAFLRRAAPERWEVRVTSAEGGASRVLTEIGGTSIAWTSDAGWMAVTDRPGPDEPTAVFLVSSTTGARIRRVTRPPAGTLGDLQCAVSPDGAMLAVARYLTTGVADVYVLALGSVEAEPHRLTNDRAAVEGLAWTPDGSALVFASTRDGRKALWRIAARPASDSRPTLVDGVEGNASTPTFSRPAPGRSPSLVYVHDLTTSGIWRWSETEPGSSVAQPAMASTTRDEYPAVSLDGRLIAFTSHRSGRADVWVATAAGASPRRLTFRDDDPAFPRWSPNGGWIAYTGLADSHRDILLVRGDGADVRRLTSTTSDEFNPSWSHDGRWVYFTSNRTGRPRIWRTPADGSGAAQAVSPGEGAQARESPDGRTLYFVRGSAMSGLWSMPVEGGPETEVIPGSAVREGWWDVTRDGIVFLDSNVSDASRGPTRLRRYRFDTHQIETLASLPIAPDRIGLGLSASMDGRVVYWTQVEHVRSDLMIVDRWPPGRP